MNPELQSQIQLWRAKAIDGTLSLDEQRDAIRALRAGRLAAAERAKATRAKREKAPVRDAASLLSGIGIKV